MPQTKQFDTFDNLGDRKELVILCQRLGEGLPEYESRRVRADFLEGLMVRSLGKLAAKDLTVNPDQCGPVGTYMLFCAIAGGLEVPIAEAAKILDDAVRKREWMRDDRRREIFEKDESGLIDEMRTIIHCTK